MAYASTEGVTKALSPRNSSTSYDAMARQEVSVAPLPIEYDVERIEKVYKKLDLRIIPGIYISIPQPAVNYIYR